MGLVSFTLLLRVLGSKLTGETDASWEEGNIGHFKLVRHMLVDPKESKMEYVIVELGQNGAP